MLYIRSWLLGLGGRRQSCPFGDWCIYPIKEKHSKNQTGKYSFRHFIIHVVPHEIISIVNPNWEKQIGISNPKEDPSWLQKEVITGWQRENLAPTKFEIQIWVFNFGRRVEYSKIWRDRFPFAWITFLLRRQSRKQTDVDTILKTLRPTPGSTHCFA